MAPLGHTKSKYVASRIDKELLFEKATREELLRVLADIDAEDQREGVKDPRRKWEAMKARMYDFLLSTTRERRKQARESDVYRPLKSLEFQLGMLQRGTESPSQGLTKKIDSLKTRIKTEFAAIKAASPRTSFSRTSIEEESTKAFYRQFRSAHANMNINEIYCEDDWANHTQERTTTDPPEILSQIADYYQWLYQPKATSEPDKLALLKILRTDPIPEETAARADRPLTLTDVQKAIRSAGSDRAPGPDGLPAEFYKRFEDLLAAPMRNMLAECKREGELTSTMREGEVILIYKKRTRKTSATTDPSHSSTQTINC